MQSPCGATEDCQRAACYLVEDDRSRKLLCYFHAACLAPTTLASARVTLLQVPLAKQQSRAFKNLAAEVWDELALELKDARAKAKTTLPPPRSAAAATTTTSQHQQYEQQDSSNNNNKRNKTSFLSLVESAPSVSSFSAPFLNTPCPQERCPQCGHKGGVAYVCISSAISAGKSDTWGNSSRPDRVLKYTCSGCLHAWLVEEG